METQVTQKRSKPLVNPRRKSRGQTYEAQHVEVQSILHSNRIQPKLRLGQPNDEYEQEADQVAEQVMRMPAPQAGSLSSEDHPSPDNGNAHSKIIQLACVSCEKDQALIHSKKKKDIIAELSPEVSTDIQAPRSQQSFLGPRNGTDFSNEVHSTPTQQCPKSALGRQAQQLQTKLTVNEPGDKYERETGTKTEWVMEGRVESCGAAVSPTPTAPPTLHRKMADQGAANEPQQTVDSHVALALRSSKQPLDPDTRNFMESRFNFDFSDVRIYTGEAAVASAQALNARAYTLGSNIVFGAGAYSSQSTSGRKLLAHELTHVVQQGGASTYQRVDRSLDSSFGTRGDNARAIDDEERRQTLAVPGKAATPDIQREEETPAVPTPAVPTLTLTPGNTLTRGDNLAAVVSFTATAGETFTATDWTYTTASLGAVTRAATDANFQARWEGVMALSGDLVMTYTITPASGTAGAEQTLQESITVNDRTGATWQSTVTDEAEAAYAGQPSPPELFSHLGLHNSGVPALPNPTDTPIVNGPNHDFHYVSALTAGNFTSSPFVHPDVTNQSSAFGVFHQDPSRLYLVNGSTRTLIPLTEYSNLSVSGSTLTFDVPDWTLFYKAHNYYTLTATAAVAGNTVPVLDAWWELAANSSTASLSIIDEPALRAALGIPATEGYSVNATSNSAWDGVELMQAADILSGTQSHEYAHATHSHRANFHAMMRALDPQRWIENKVGTPGNAVNFTTEISNLWAQIILPNHELVDEAASRAQGIFVAASGNMAGVNTDPATGDFLGSVWDITNDQQMS